LGQQDNPYPFIKHAHLLVNTSLSEACPYVVNEAKVLGTPVICTNFGSARQFITNGEDGYSVPLAEMPDAILNLLADQEAYDRIKCRLARFEYDNAAIVNQFMKLINDNNNS
jgi:glycosyltransferase involved in cell wall biosynthesis